MSLISGMVDMYMTVQQGVGETDVVVIGAGQAGLSSAYHLKRLGFASGTGFVVLDSGSGPGGAWRERSPSLTMEKVHGVFQLPGTKWTPDASAAPQAAASVVGAYFADYERRYDLPVQRPVQVRAVRRGDDNRFVVETDAALWLSRFVINATGTWTRPYWPYYPGTTEFGGRQIHSADYRGPAAFAGMRVVVVGGGHSATHVLSEIAGVAASTTWVTRRPPEFHTGDFGEDYGRRVIAKVEERVRAGLPPKSVVDVTGLGYTPVVQEAMAKGALERLPVFDGLCRTGSDGTTAG